MTLRVARVGILGSRGRICPPLPPASGGACPPLPPASGGACPPLPPASGGACPPLPPASGGACPPACGCAVASDASEAAAVPSVTGAGRGRAVTRYASEAAAALNMSTGSSAVRPSPISASRGNSVAVSAGEGMPAARNRAYSRAAPTTAIQPTRAPPAATTARKRLSQSRGVSIADAEIPPRRGLRSPKADRGDGADRTSTGRCSVKTSHPWRTARRKRRGLRRAHAADGGHEEARRRYASTDARQRRDPGGLTVAQRQPPVAAGRAGYKGRSGLTMHKAARRVTTQALHAVPQASVPGRGPEPFLRQAHTLELFTGKFGLRPPFGRRLSRPTEQLARIWPTARGGQHSRRRCCVACCARHSCLSGSGHESRLRCCVVRGCRRTRAATRSAPARKKAGVDRRTRRAPRIRQ